MLCSVINKLSLLLEVLPLGESMIVDFLGIIYDYRLDFSDAVSD